MIHPALVGAAYEHQKWPHFALCKMVLSCQVRSDTKIKLLWLGHDVDQVQNICNQLKLKLFDIETN